MLLCQFIFHIIVAGVLLDNYRCESINSSFLLEGPIRIQLVSIFLLFLLLYLNIDQCLVCFEEGRRHVKGYDP